VDVGWVRLESAHTIGPWFRWASVGIDCVPSLVAEVGLTVAEVPRIGSRVVASLVA
ncbi:SAM-dependent methyltransferase, partial [Mycobacterium sp. ITM-2017-0098]